MMLDAQVHELKTERHELTTQAELYFKGLEDLQNHDPELQSMLDGEVGRQHRTLSLVASCCAVIPRSLAAASSALVNVTAEGVPGKRYHAGCQYVDQVESLAIDRAKTLFGAQYAGVQSHSASSANYQVFSALLDPGDTILGMALDHGGHLTHGSPVTFSGRTYHAIGYGTTREGVIDYDQVRALASEHRPKLIICGATAYSRHVDFDRFRQIADEVGAVLMADISHVAGLVATGRLPSPIDAAHVTTTCTHKQLSGPRGGLIMSGRDAETVLPGSKLTLARRLEQGIFPKMQGAPAVNIIAAKAAAFGYALTSEFDAYMSRIRDAADTVAEAFLDRGYDVLGGKTVNHTVLIHLSGDVTGQIAEEALEECGILVNKNRVPGETRSSFVTSGLRIGSGSMAQRRVDRQGCREIADLVCDVIETLIPLSETEYKLSAEARADFQKRAESLCARFPITDYTA